MTQLAQIQGHIASMGELLDIIGAMRSLAGMRVQEAQRALPGIRAYAASIADAVGTALLAVSSPPQGPAAGRGRRALILCAAEHGFVGGFNEHILAAAKAAGGPRDLLFVLGSRGAALAFEHGRKPDWVRPMATRPEGTLDGVRALTAELYRRIARGEIGRVEVIFGRYEPGGGLTVAHLLLLPLDLAALAPARRRQPPLRNLPPEVLLERLVSEYVFALLTEAAVESIASENAARFSAMESAHDNVAKKLDQLKQEARLARQNEITTELLDLATGAEAQSAAAP